MTFQDVKKAAAQKMSLCKVCPVCNGQACKGMVPGPGGSGNGRSFIKAVEYLNNIDIMMDIIYEQKGAPDLSYNFYGHQMCMPVLGAPIGGVKLNYGIEPEVITDRDFIYAQLKGAVDAGTIAFLPEGPGALSIANNIDLVAELGGMTVPTVKPWANEIMKGFYAQAEAMGAVACASDVDSAGLINLRLAGQPAFPKSQTDLADLASSIKGPFIVKGIVTVKAALAAVEAGAKGIVISNHGGRIMQDAPAPVSVLKEIREAVGPDITLFVDGGIRTGADVFKCLALGADAVLIGRPLGIAAIGGGAEGVQVYYDKIRAELEDCMVLTGCHTLADITIDKIRNQNT